MKKYLSSYRLWDNPQEWVNLFWENKNVAFIMNACDGFADYERFENKLDVLIRECEDLWLKIKKIDLKKYFWKIDTLRFDLENFWWVLVAGWNTFVLRQAFHLSWFDQILWEYENNNPNFVYAWWSAGICILAPTLHGLDIVDDSNCHPYDSLKTTIWEWLGILDYAIMPHYDSDHPESKLVDETITYCIEHKILFTALRDGEVLIYN